MNGGGDAEGSEGELSAAEDVGIVLERIRRQRPGNGNMESGLYCRQMICLV
jgi:hypothetical protein